MIAAFTGGGGKTSLIYALAEHFAGEGKRVIVTTTTHMAWEPGRPFAGAEDVSLIRRLLSRYGYVTVAYHPAGALKISGPDREILEKLPGLCDVVLVEADGSKRLPLKVPAQWEPVIPESADVVVGVIGLDCIGKKISDTAHRPQDVAGFLGKSLSDAVTWEDVAEIAVSKKGLRKGVGRRRFLVYLNKMDVLKSPDMAMKILEKCRLAGIDAVCGSLRRPLCQEVTKK